MQVERNRHFLRDGVSVIVMIRDIDLNEAKVAFSGDFHVFVLVLILKLICAT